eukprot:GHVU01060198.1.p1 GENE.GHVU01060198.1~~GHVU01060198.1.p1  ORF type:complete len:479 (+),score=110.48 GHVU01060198.1:251-1687(+)
MAPVKRRRPSNEESSVTSKKREIKSSLTPEAETKCVNTIRCLAADIVSKANSGHPGGPMGCAPMAHVLWSEAMNYAPAHPDWFNRDRFVLSNGHCSALLYSMLHISGYKVSIDDLKKFRQYKSITPGHPERGVTPGVEVSTGPLGQGISNAVGLAIAANHMAATYNKPDFELFDNYTYVLCGDGCMQEGVASEAASLAGHLKLDRLVALYDDNSITIDGSTGLSFSENVRNRFKAYGWTVTDIAEGDNDIQRIANVVHSVKNKPGPQLVCVKTTIGFGSANAGSEKTHGSPLTAEDLKQTKKTLGLDADVHFQIPEEVAAHYRAVAEAGEKRYQEWIDLFAKYEAQYANEASELKRRMKNELPDKLNAALEALAKDDSNVATRASSGKVLNAVAAAMPEVVGGSADLTESNKSHITGSTDFTAATPAGRYLRFGVREHGMLAVSNGLQAYGGFRPFAATFLNFISYGWGAARLSALSE